ncbi:helix-turn-helix domain-containing protein [Nonomuraea sp. NPDC048881]|uniref:helix-turn-helix domain-containing protein n=1 Tax=Nonomuraea sp. NPDC048881 TaxID=3155030 RepID=UPI00340B5328
MNHQRDQYGRSPSDSIHLQTPVHLKRSRAHFQGDAAPHAVRSPSTLQLIPHPGQTGRPHFGDHAYHPGASLSHRRCRARRSTRSSTHAGLAAAKARGVRLGRPPAMPPEQVRRARPLLAQSDATVSSIARLLNVSRSTICKYVRELATAALPSTSQRRDLSWKRRADFQVRASTLLTACLH